MTSLELLRDLDITSAVINHICFINKFFLPSVRNRNSLRFHAILHVNLPNGSPQGGRS